MAVSLILNIDHIKNILCLIQVRWGNVFKNPAGIVPLREKTQRSDRNKYFFSEIGKNLGESSVLVKYVQKDCAIISFNLLKLKAKLATKCKNNKDKNAI